MAESNTGNYTCILRGKSIHGKQFGWAGHVTGHLPVTFLPPPCHLPATFLLPSCGRTPLLLQLQPACIQLVIHSPLPYQALMVSPLSNTSMVQYHDSVGIADGGKPVGYDEYGPALHQLIHASLHHSLCPGINAGSGFIQNQDRRICNGCPRNG